MRIRIIIINVREIHKNNHKGEIKMLKNIMTKKQIAQDVKDFTLYNGMGSQAIIEVAVGGNQVSTIMKAFTKDQLWDIREYQLKRYNELQAAGELPSQFHSM